MPGYFRFYRDVTTITKNLPRSFVMTALQLKKVNCHNNALRISSIQYQVSSIQLNEVKSRPIAPGHPISSINCPNLFFKLFLKILTV